MLANLAISINLTRIKMYINEVSLNFKVNQYKIPPFGPFQTTMLVTIDYDIYRMSHAHLQRKYE